MAVDTWNDQHLSLFERAFPALRFVAIAVFWLGLVAGPPVVGGVLGWMATQEVGESGPLSGLLGQLPDDQVGVTITREEVQAVGLDPSDVKAILTE